MGFRFRLGPFTFGKSGTRLSLWKGGTGVSIPLFNKNNGGTFGKVKVGPVIGFFGSPLSKTPSKQRQQDELPNLSNTLSTEEMAAIETFGNDKHFIGKLKKHGLPWRSIQEILKDALPEQLNDRNNVAYRLVPKAMNATFGKQDTSWKTKKRPSKSGNGQTTWIEIL